MEQQRRQQPKQSWQVWVGIIAAVTVTAVMVSVVVFGELASTTDPAPAPANLLPKTTASLAGSGGEPAANHTSDGDAQTYAKYSEADEASCTSRGGDYYMASEYYVCQMPVSDEGKQCTDNSQCVGICRAESEEDSEGMCTTFSHGCDIYLEDGQTHWMCS